VFCVVLFARHTTADNKCKARIALTNAQEPLRIVEMSSEDKSSKKGLLLLLLLLLHWLLLCNSACHCCCVAFKTHSLPFAHSPIYHSPGKRGVVRMRRRMSVGSKTAVGRTRPRLESNFNTVAVRCCYLSFPLAIVCLFVALDVIIVVTLSLQPLTSSITLMSTTQRLFVVFCCVLCMFAFRCVV